MASSVDNKNDLILKVFFFLESVVIQLRVNMYIMQTLDADQFTSASPRVNSKNVDFLLVVFFYMCSYFYFYIVLCVCCVENFG